MSGAPPLLAAERLSVTIGEAAILRDASLTAAPGELLAILGPNGAGKTTLLRALAGLVPATGQVIVQGRPLARMRPRERARALAYLPQGHVFHWPLPVAEIVALGRLPHGGGGGLSAADRAAVARAMAATGVTGFADRAVTGLSGGERARVALARLLAVEAPILLADEPIAALDPRYQLQIIGLLRRLAGEGRAVVVVLHDLALAARHADRVVVLSRGAVVAEGRPQAVLTDLLLGAVFGIDVRRVTVDGVPVLLPWEAGEGGR